MYQNEIRTYSGNKNYKVKSESGLIHKKVFGSHVSIENIQQICTFDMFLTGTDYFSDRYSQILECSTDGSRYITRKFVEGGHYDFSVGNLKECIALLDNLLDAEIPLSLVNQVECDSFATYLSRIGVVSEVKLPDAVVKFKIEEILCYLNRQKDRIEKQLTVAHHLTHGDIQSQNLVYKKKKLISIIDWDEVRISSFPYDIGKSYWQLCKVGRGNFQLSSKLCSEYIKHFLNRFTEEQLKFIFVLGATYFIPNQYQYDKIRSDTNQIDWYINWIIGFWRVFDSNIDLTYRLLKNKT